MANTNVAKKAEAKLPALSLDMMESDAHSGLENIQQDDLATPRLKIKYLPSSVKAKTNRLESLLTTSSRWVMSLNRKYG